MRSEWLNLVPKDILAWFFQLHGQRTCHSTHWPTVVSTWSFSARAGRVHSCAKHIRTFYKTNGVKIELNEPLRRTVIYKDRSPKPEEPAKMLDVATLRSKVIITLLALGGFREETLSKLHYSHVKDDLKAKRTPLPVHIEIEITKGKYCDFDTFLGQEAVECLTLYLQQRRQGSPDGRNPPEQIENDSPILRDETSREPRGIGPKQIRKIVHNLYATAGLLKEPKGRMYDLRTHSIRKFFKTQMVSLGVPDDYAEYMMGHKINTYNDVQMKGVEFLRNVYAASGLSIRPKTKVNKIDMLKEMIRSMGMNPEQVLTREALNQPARTIVGSEDRQNGELEALSTTLRELIRQEVNTEKVHIRT